MLPENNNPHTLVSVADELEAAMVVSALAAQGVDATTTGSYTAGFRAEAPGDVQVLVRHCDLPQARRALEELPLRASAAQTVAAIAPPTSAWLVKMLIFILLSIGILQSCF